MIRPESIFSICTSEVNLLIMRGLVTLNPGNCSHVYLGSLFHLRQCLLNLGLQPDNVTSASSMTALTTRCLSLNCHTCLRCSLYLSQALRQSLRKAGIIINSQQHCAGTGIHLDAFTRLPATVTANTRPSSHLIYRGEKQVLSHSIKDKI